jgi:hypothetical protein
MERFDHLLGRIKRAIRPASPEILDTHGNAAIDEGLGRESDLPALNSGLKHIPHVDAQPSTNLGRNDDLVFAFHYNDSHAGLSRSLGGKFNC